MSKKSEFGENVGILERQWDILTKQTESGAIDFGDEETENLFKKFYYSGALACWEAVTDARSAHDMRVSLQVIQKEIVMFEESTIRESEAH